MRMVDSSINKKTESKVRSKEMIFCAVIMGIFLFVLFTGFAYKGRNNDYKYSDNTNYTSTNYNADNRYSDIIRYSSIKINEGDTMSDIATRYMPDGISKEDYINNLKKINGLSDCEINAGKYLVIYYYKD